MRAGGGDVAISTTRASLWERVGEAGEAGSKL